LPDDGVCPECGSRDFIDLTHGKSADVLAGLDGPTLRTRLRRDLTDASIVVCLILCLILGAGLIGHFWAFGPQPGKIVAGGNWSELTLNDLARRVDGKAISRCLDQSPTLGDGRSFDLEVRVRIDSTGHGRVVNIKTSARPKLRAAVEACAQLASDWDLRAFADVGASMIDVPMRYHNLPEDSDHLELPTEFEQVAEISPKF